MLRILSLLSKKLQINYDPLFTLIVVYTTKKSTHYQKEKTMLIEKNPEITWLLLTIGLTGMLWVPYILQLIIQMGPIKAIWDPQGTHPHDAQWALRAKRAHYNSVENLAVFAPLVLLTTGLDLQNETTASACIVYFFARVSHYAIYVFAIPVIRTVAFLIGFACQAVLFLNILQNL